MLNVNDFIADVGKWLCKPPKCPDDDVADYVPNDNHEQEEIVIGPHDSISNVISNKGSKLSSHKSRKSNKSSTSSACIKAEAEKAALIARAAALKEKHALQEQEESLRRKREQLELDTEIAASSARLAILQSCGSHVSERGSDGMESYFRKEAESKNVSTLLSPHGKIDEHHLQYESDQVQRNIHSRMEKTIAPDYYSQREATYSQREATHRKHYDTYQQNISRSVLNPLEQQTKQEVIQPTLSTQVSNHTPRDLYDVLQRQNDITTLLVQMQTSQYLPHREIPTFAGDPLQFKIFMKAFEHSVEAKTNNKGDCLYFLEQFTRGQPRDLVRSCLHMTPERGYSNAKHLLEEHFGNGLKVTAAYMEKITGWPSVKSEDTKGLQAYAFFLRECSNAMEELQYLDELNMPANMKMMIQKLPYKLREKWRVRACEILDRDHKRACFMDIVRFIEQQVRIVSDPVFGDIQDAAVIKGTIKSKPQMKTQFNRNSFATHVSIANESKADVSQHEMSSTKVNPISCLYCAGGHALEQCPQLERKVHREKLDFLKEKGLCFGCLSTGHLSKNCDRRISCKYCNQTHPSVLHIKKKEWVNQGHSELPNKKSVSHTPTSTCGHTGAGNSSGILPILPVQIKCAKGKKMIETYVFLDPGSTGTFCSEKLVDRLNTQGRRAKIHLRTMGHSKAVPTCIVNGLEISNLSGTHFYKLPDVFTQKEMPVSPNNIVGEEELAKWLYLKDIQIPRITADVDLLIGTNASKLMEPWDVINSRNDGPYAVRTLLGWVINGPLPGNDDKQSACPEVIVNRTVVERIEGLLINQYNNDFNEKASNDQEEMSREEKKFVEIVESSVQLKEGHYTMKLPFKKENVTIPINLYVAKQRIYSKKKKGFMPGDIVVVVDSTAPRGSWVLGRILKTFPDRKGLVRSVRLKTKTNVIE